MLLGSVMYNVSNQLYGISRYRDIFIPHTNKKHRHNQAVSCSKEVKAKNVYGIEYYI
jgi:hypothetical protein